MATHQSGNYCSPAPRFRDYLSPTYDLYLIIWRKKKKKGERKKEGIGSPRVCASPTHLVQGPRVQKKKKEKEGGGGGKRKKSTLANYTLGFPLQYTLRISYWGEKRRGERGKKRGQRISSHDKNRIISFRPLK